MGWLLLTYKLPSNERSRARVAVWREVRRCGGLHLQQSVVAFPATSSFRPAVERFRSLVAEVGGETLVIEGEPLEESDGQSLVESWNAARDAEYAELVGVGAKFLTEIHHEFEIEKFTLAELEEEEAELDKLQRWHARIAERDIHGASGAGEAGEALERASAELARYADAVFERTQP